MSLPIAVYIILAGVLFTLGALTVLLRRNAIIELMGVELMLNAVNLVLVTFSRIHGNLTGQVFAFFVMVVAAAEVVVGHYEIGRASVGKECRSRWSPYH